MKRFGILLGIAIVLSLIKIFIIPDTSKNFYCEEVSGFLYRAPWNASYQLLFVTDDYTCLVNTSGMSYETRKMAQKGVIVTIRKTTFKVPSGARNVGLFNQKRYYKSKGVSYICTPKEDNMEFGGKYKLKYLIHLPGARFRAYASDILYDSMDYESGNFTLAVMTGDTGRVNTDDKNLFTNSGLSHLMCVSGMHVLYFIMPFRKMTASESLDFRRRKIILIFPLIAFLSLADFSPSVFRASFSMFGLLISGIFLKKHNPLGNLMLSASILLLINPYYLVSTGFLLSYMSVLSLHIIYPVFLKKFSWFRNNDSGKTIKIRLVNKETLAAGISVNLGIAPIMMIIFGSFSFYGIILTLFASPLAAGICIAGYLCAFVALIPGLSVIGTFIGKILYFLYKLIIKVASISELIPGGVINVSKTAAYIVAAAVYGSLFIIILWDNRKFKQIFCKIKPKNKKTVCIYLVSSSLIISCVFCITYKETLLEVTCADVGQGLCVIVRSGNMCGLIDTGDGSSDLEEILDGYGISKINFIIITHGHSDHAGGLSDILSHYLGTLILPDIDNESLNDIEQEAIEKNWNVIKAGNGDNFKIGKAKAEFICVSEYFTENTDSAENNSSLCVRLSCKSGSVFVAADIEQEAETIMCENNLIKESDVLIVPHHGSKYSSSENLLMNINGRYGIISVGSRNSYGHPSDETLERLTKFGYSVMRTDQDGASGVRMGRKTIFRKGYISVWTML